MEDVEDDDVGYESRYLQRRIEIAPLRQRALTLRGQPIGMTRAHDLRLNVFDLIHGESCRPRADYDGGSWLCQPILACQPTLGTRSVNRAPPPGLSSTSNCPAWAAAMRCVMA